MKKLQQDPGILFLILGFLGLTLFYLWPFLLSLWYAFADKPVNGTFVGLKNFIDLFHNKPYLLGLKNTLIFIGMSVPAGILLALIVAMLIHRVEKKKELFTLIFLIPLVIPSGSMVFFWKALFVSDGYINGVLASIGLSGVHWFETSAVRYVVVLIFIWKNLGYNMVLFMAGLHNIPKEYYEAAAVDGASALQTFFCVTLPNLIPMFVLVIIMSVINSFKVFKEIYLITGSYPHESIYMLQHFMNNMLFSLNYQKLTTATCVLVLIIALMVQFLFRFERRAGI
ncbi:carbohydrate ABC transporter permease [Sinanaerobacter chloroacetimidivorans]|uniref:Sugar ABC transporter permease n=1 Tax=Sinanaerobacter chloroacetimidivorans TaxID=2818044 RepID=A0A8J7W2F1_9FIRM|nr:sugar ABC transporter permease [Sinanaerobacter chloroacetimidivorans]MBR0599652.1 sugar ABC transporter permease [Sinanaerobacter chloroacetimidivorans]